MRALALLLLVSCSAPGYRGPSVPQLLMPDRVRVSRTNGNGDIAGRVPFSDDSTSGSIEWDLTDQGVWVRAASLAPIIKGLALLSAKVQGIEDRVAGVEPTSEEARLREVYRALKEHRDPGPVSKVTPSQWGGLAGLLGVVALLFGTKGRVITGALKHALPFLKGAWGFAKKYLPKKDKPK